MSTGLSHNSVLCVIQSRDGFIWMGTRDGLCRFDGINYDIFKQNSADSGSISNNSVNCLFEASNGDLWIGTNMGLNCLPKNSTNFKKYFNKPAQKGLSHNYVRCIIESIPGEILIGTLAGVDLLNVKTETFEDVNSKNDDQGEAGNVFCFYKEDESKIWIGTRKGLYFFSNRNISKIQLPDLLTKNFNYAEIRDIEKSPDNKLWVATEGHGLYIFSIQNSGLTSEKHFDRSNSKIPSDNVRKVLIRNNEVWIGTMEGLSIFDKTVQKFSNFQYNASNPEGISQNSIRDIFEDSQGGIWISTYAGGVNYYHLENNLFPHYKMTPGKNNFLPSNVISVFFEDSNGDLWIGTEGAGLVLFEKSTNKYTTFKAESNSNQIAHNNIKSITTDSKGNLWIGTYNGLSFFDKKSRSFTNYVTQPGNQNSLINNQVHTVVVDSAGLIWIGTNGGGVQLFNPESKSFVPVHTAKVKNVNVLLHDKKGRIWIGHQQGLVCLNAGNQENIDLKTVSNQLSLPVQYVLCLYADKSNRIWIGTQGTGLLILDGDSVKRVTSDNGLPDNTINAIAEDNSGNFWISTNKGLSKITVNKQDLHDIEVQNFSKSQGLQGFQYLPMSVLKSKSGEIYFGGVNGFNFFNPEKIIVKDHNIPLIIREFKARSTKKGKKDLSFGNIISEKVVFEIDYDFRDVSVEFLGINYIDLSNTYYRYKLNGLDRNWIDLDRQNLLNFNFLPPGNYELLLQASSKKNVWETEFQSLRFTILPPWWLTFWAFVGYTAVLALLLFVFFQVSQRWVKLNNQLSMEHFQREKEEELHKLKLRFFTDVSHELRTPLTLILSPLEQIIKHPDLNMRILNQLTSIRQNGLRMMQLINKILDLRRLDSGYNQLQAAPGNLEKFLEETSLSFKETAIIKQIDFSYISGKNIPVVYFEREKMEIIVYNLLSNAFKNTPKGGKITLELKTRDNDANSVTGISVFAEIKVTDNGIGIPSNLKEKIFERFYTSGSKSGEYSMSTGVGLELTKRLVELHKGQIFVESSERDSEHERFTCFTVLIPTGKNHLIESEIISEPMQSHDFGWSEHLQSDLALLDENFVNTYNEEKTNDSQSPKNILLIVEDNQEVRTLVKNIFEEQFVVKEAGDGTSGLENALKIIPDLIISDIMMPGMNGIEMCKKLKTDIRTSHIPVILLTARTAITFRYEGLETGADDYITKPFSPEYLQLRVKNLIKQRELIRSHFIRQAICDPAKITVTSVDEKLLKKAVEYISNHMQDPALSVESLSSELGLSRVHFYRKIKALTNQTAVEFIRSIRMKRAASLLEENKLNVNEVSLTVGFEDTDYFRECFKQQFGTSPAEYSKRFRNNT